MLRMLVFLCGWAGVMSEGFALPPPPQEDMGFVHSFYPQDHLPSNARGVLFLFCTRICHETIVTVIPKTLGPGSFSITQSGRKGTLKAIVHGLNIEAQIDLSQRRYRLLDPVAKACYQTIYNKSMLLDKCRSVMQDLEALNQESIRHLAVAGKMQDVTSAVEKATGLFRISPEGGFQVGKTYTITYVGNKNKKNPWQYPSRIQIVIDDQAMSLESDGFKLELQNAPKKRSVWLMPEFPSFPAIEQDLIYSVPSAYAAYHEYMVFFTEQESFAKLSGSRRSLEASPVSGFLHSLSHQSQVDQAMPYRLEDQVYCVYRTPKKSSPVTQIRGLIGFLEMEDHLHETPIVEVNFGNEECASTTNIYLWLLPS